MNISWRVYIKTSQRNIQTFCSVISGNFHFQSALQTLKPSFCLKHLERELVQVQPILLLSMHRWANWMLPPQTSVNGDWCNKSFYSQKMVMACQGGNVLSHCLRFWIRFSQNTSSEEYSYPFPTGNSGFQPWAFLSYLTHIASTASFFFFFCSWTLSNLLCVFRNVSICSELEWNNIKTSLKPIILSVYCCYSLGMLASSIVVVSYKLCFEGVLSPEISEQGL